MKKPRVSAGSEVAGLPLPSQVKVGHLVFRVEPWAAVEAARAENLGECDYLLLCIRVRDDLSPALAGEVLLHEVLHAVYRVFGVPKGGDEESVVETVANGLATVFADNPDLLTALGRFFPRDGEWAA